MIVHSQRPSALDGPGAYLVDRIVRECLTDILTAPVETTALRLLAAADFADVLDQEMDASSYCLRSSARLANLCYGTYSENGFDKRRLGELPAPITHCHLGHEFTPENTHVDRRGRRVCRALSPGGSVALCRKKVGGVVIRTVNPCTRPGCLMPVVVMHGDRPWCLGCWRAVR